MTALKLCQLYMYLSLWTNCFRKKKDKFLNYLNTPPIDFVTINSHKSFTQRTVKIHLQEA